MIQEMKLIPVPEGKHPFAAAAGKCRFDEIGYVEDEYFMSGTANVYGEDASQNPGVEIPDAPYTTRLLIRRPQDVKRFSGNVVIEVLNATAMLDIDRMWVDTWKFFTRNGDIYIGISSKGQVVDSLKRFDAERYAPINWNNPDRSRTPLPEVKDRPMMFMEQYESGLFWDMLIDLARLVRTEEEKNPLAAYVSGNTQKNLVFLTGWSQSGGYIARILHSFAHQPEIEKDGSLFDGYLLAGCGVSDAPMNAYSTAFRFGRSGIPMGSILGSREPVIAVNTESENKYAFWYGDFDEPEFKFRTWQIPASSHDTDYNLIEYYEGYQREDLNKIGITNVWEGCEGEPMDCPYEPIFNAAFYHLYNWARYDIPAPHAPKIETRIVPRPNSTNGFFGNSVINVTDAFGNAVGGIRHPAVDCPTGTYTSFSKRADGTVQEMFGHVMPFAPEQLKALYGSLEHYRSLVEESTDNAIAKGFVLAEDRDELIERVVATAKRRGLE